MYTPPPLSLGGRTHLPHHHLLHTEEEAGGITLPLSRMFNIAPYIHQKYGRARANALRFRHALTRHNVRRAKQRAHAYAPLLATQFNYRIHIPCRKLPLRRASSRAKENSMVRWLRYDI